jgi:imidazolonepropionase-like amidohydrolase
MKQNERSLKTVRDVPCRAAVLAGLIVALTPADARVIDLGDRTLLPGLMDMHVHLSPA